MRTTNSDKGKFIELRLTPAQREELRALTGKDGEVLALTAEELKHRILPQGIIHW